MSIFLMSTWHLSLFSFSCILTFGYLPFFKCHTRKCLLANDILANVMDSKLHIEAVKKNNTHNKRNDTLLHISASNQHFSML